MSCPGDTCSGLSWPRSTHSVKGSMTLPTAPLAPSPTTYLPAMLKILEWPILPLLFQISMPSARNVLPLGSFQAFTPVGWLPDIHEGWGLWVRTPACVTPLLASLPLPRSHCVAITALYTCFFPSPKLWDCVFSGFLESSKLTHLVPTVKEKLELIFFSPSFPPLCSSSHQPPPTLPKGHLVYLLPLSPSRDLCFPW